MSYFHFFIIVRISINPIPDKIQFTIIIILIGITLGKVINSNTKHTILRPCFGISYKFQELLNHSFDGYCITVNLILPIEQDVFINEIGNVHNFVLSHKGYTPSSDFKTQNVRYSFFCSFRPL